jgi:ATPase subunit of ABC transporter with duplicated ATPase domains
MIGVSKHYDKKPVLKNISLSYFYGAKIGVLGLNGSGKTSLLRILAGVDQNFNGETVLSQGYTVGYLEQEPLVNVDEQGITLLKTAMEKLSMSARAYDRIIKVARTIADLDGEEKIGSEHLAEAIQYRSLDRESWGT